MFPRSAGVLVHPTSFPSRYGIGDLGESAYRFIDFLVHTKQSLWQILPLGPTGYGDSPYQSFSAFAGNPLMLSPDLLVADGYLPRTAVAHVPDFPSHKVDFGWIIPYKNGLVQQAHAHFEAHGTAEQRAAFAAFQQEQASWLDDYALFMALKQHHVEHEGGVWNTWPADIAQRQPKALKAWRKKLAAEFSLYQFGQFLFFDQWFRLKNYANQRGIQVVGDIPIFVAFDSADVWGNPSLFYLDDAGAPTVIAGVPPDYFSATGQRWGNPLYRWDVLEQSGFAWWLERIQATLKMVDIVRIDHFRGFEAYWEIPATEPTAMNGRWVTAPGMALFRTLQEKMGDLPIIAEDLGVITPEVEELRDTFGLPGMKILQFAFGGEHNSAFLPHGFTANSVVYTGSHDNETTLGWYRNATQQEQDHLRRYVARDGSDAVWDMIRLAHASVSNTAVIPLQDLMELGNEARMNFPGLVGGYWAWRYLPHMITDTMAYRLREMTVLYGRVPAAEA